jgi:hypothetical protein
VSSDADITQGTGEEMSDCEGEIRRVGDEVDGVVFTEEALKSQDGKTVPLTLEPGGPVIGEATLKYDPERKALAAAFEIDDPDVEEFLMGPCPMGRDTFIFRDKES